MMIDRLPRLGWKEQAGLLLVTMLVSDALITTRPFLPRLAWAPFDSLFHGLIAVFIVLRVAQRRPEQSLRLVAAAFWSGVLLDADHFAAAASFSIRDAVSLPCRPWSHSLTFALAVALLLGRVAGSRLWPAAVGIGLASHVLRDAGGGACTPIFWPLGVDGIPYLVYLFATLGLGWLMLAYDSRIHTTGEDS